jgi:imidazolonepropionase-like amidohydrolase
MTGAAERVLLRGCRLLDPAAGEPCERVDVLVEGERVREVSERPLRDEAARVVDVGGRTLMPGLIDAHAHVYLSEVDLLRLEDLPPALLVARAAARLRGMLDRGYTTVRDVAGADWGIREAVEGGLFPGPRLFIAGRAITQTGGHGDVRPRTRRVPHCAGCGNGAPLARVADGPDEVRRAVRDELRLGADQVKLMVSGGVASPTDPLEGTQLTREEIGVAVEEARAWDRYVCAHAYGADAVARAVECGVRSIEHGNLIDAPTARLMAERGAFLVPTLVTYDAIRRRGRELGLAPVSLEKNARVLDAGLRSLELARSAGVPIGLGTDLLGELDAERSRELLIRAEVERPLDILRSATVVNARLIGRDDELGRVAPGALADLLVVEGDPLADLGPLVEAGARMPVVMARGRLHRDLLGRP